MTKKYWFSFGMIVVMLFSLHSFTHKTDLIIAKQPPISQVNQPTLKDKIQPITYTDGFDYPVGKPDGKGYYNAQGFGKNGHLGDDWNGNGGGNTDLGDTIYNIANGKVTFAEDVKGGWGNVIRITHYLNDSTQVESLYAHCQKILITSGRFLSKGEPIGTIGTAGGIYPAHLHFEMRSKIGMPIGGGYSANTKGYLNPTTFIKKNR